MLAMARAPNEVRSRVRRFGMSTTPIRDRAPDRSHFAVGIVDGAALVVEDHRSPLVRGVSRPVGLAGAREGGPGPRYAVSQRLGIRLVMALADHIQRVEDERHFDRMAR